MNTENEILAEIHRHRAEHAKECGYDIHKMFEQMRTETARLEAEGWKVVTLSPRRPSTPLYAAKQSDASCVLREVPPESEKPPLNFKPSPPN